MGLSGKKEKQRIPVDPRNLTWADDAAKFGSNYLSRFGWDSSKGLGIDGNGRKSHIKVSHKLDMLGIGAAHQKDPNGIAWKQNKDFEILLKRLNESRTVEGEAAVVEDVEIAVEGDDTDKRERKHKRKRSRSQESPEEMLKKKKRKKEGEETVQPVESETSRVDPTLTNTPSIPPKPYIPRHRAHRARAIASKSIASKSAAAIAEILGIAPIPIPSTPSGPTTPQGKLTPFDNGLTIEKMTTSTKSVADYFKDKLLAKFSKVGPDTLAGVPEPNVFDEQDSYDLPRRGLGAPHRRLDGIDVDVQTTGIGLSDFSSLTSSSFFASTAPITATSLKEVKAAPYTEHSDNGLDTENTGEAGQEEEPSGVDRVNQDKRVAKEERRRARAEKRALKVKRRGDSIQEEI